MSPETSWETRKEVLRAVLDPKAARNSSRLHASFSARMSVSPCHQMDNPVPTNCFPDLDLFLLQGASLSLSAVQLKFSPGLEGRQSARHLRHDDLVTMSQSLS